MNAIFVLHERCGNRFKGVWNNAMSIAALLCNVAVLCNAAVLCVTLVMGDWMNLDV